MDELRGQVDYLATLLEELKHNGGTGGGYRVPYIPPLPQTIAPPAPTISSPPPAVGAPPPAPPAPLLSLNGPPPPPTNTIATGGKKKFEPVKKEVTWDALEAMVKELVVASDISSSNVPTAVQNYLNTFKEHKDKLEKLVTLYPFLVKKLALKPKSAYCK